MELSPEVIKAEEPVSALWAIDPKEVNILPSAGTLAEIKHFLGGAFSQVHPIYICADKNESLEEARAQMLEFLYALKLGPTLPPEAYRSSSEKRTEWAERILSLAHSQKDKVLLVTSHGRSAIGTFFLGSFASEILQKSDIPILFLSSHPFKKNGQHKVLFATDLSEDSKKAFVKFLDFVKGKTAEVILCHIVNLPLKPSVEKAAKMEKIMSLPDYFVEYQKEWARVEIEEFLTGMSEEKLNVKVVSVVEESRDSLPQAIEGIGKREGVRLVGVAAHGKPFEKFWLGSAVQGLLSSQKFNLWVYGPKAQESKVK